MMWGRALAIGAVAVLLSGCNVSGNGGASLVPGPQQPMLHRGGSASQDLLYISEYGGGVVDVFSYPRGKFLGNLSGLAGTPQGECVDKKGDLWVVEAGGHPTLQEFAHGGVSPIASLGTQDEEPYGCSVDPATGNLAVTSELGVGSRQGNVLVYDNAAGTPTAYVYRPILLVLWCGYDDKGNLFMDGLPSSGSREFALAELPKGGSAFIPISLERIGFPGNIQWDGSYLTVGDPAYKSGSAIYRVQVSGSSAAIVGKTVLKGSYEVFGSWIAGNAVVGPDDGPSLSTVQIWKYPAGGKPTTLDKGTSRGFNGPFGAAVSPAH